nr:MAG TPA: hypothetical protein [Microviridae sp.]
MFRNDLRQSVVITNKMLRGFAGNIQGNKINFHNVFFFGSEANIQKFLYIQILSFYRFKTSILDAAGNRRRPSGKMI